MRDLGRLNPVAASADCRQVEVLGRIDRHLVSADRAAEDDAQRIEDVRDSGRREPPLAEVVYEVLDVAPLDVRELPIAERGDDVCVEELLVATGGRRLVRLAAAVEDRAVMRAGN
ncbi:MAG: hypothetical protein M3076_18625 [Actinomycetota bacterium]|nr:hypothetical protein [Actinomycetota bacterium]